MNICTLDRRDAVQYLTLRRNVWDKRVFFFFFIKLHTPDKPHVTIDNLINFPSASLIKSVNSHQRNVHYAPGRRHHSTMTRGGAL